MRYDALGAVSRLSASRYGTFTRSEATFLGLSRAAIANLCASGALSEGPPGVLRWSSAPHCWHQDLAAAQAAGGGHGIVSCRSATRLHGLDGFENEHLLELSSTRRLKIPGAVTHIVASLPPQDVVLVDGFRVTGLARTLCDLGSVVSQQRVERALDSARRDGLSLRWLRETVQRLHRPGPSGTGKLIRTIDGLSPNSAVRGSWFEKVVEDMLTDPHIPPFIRQYEIRDEDGRFVARPDLAITELKFGVEAHSRQFHFGRAPETADEDRDLRLAGVGWDVIYPGAMSTRRPAVTAEEVRRAIVRRADQLGVDLRALCPRTRP